MKILHVITGIPKAAGTSVFCCELANALASKGHEVAVAVCDPKVSDIHPLDPRVHLASIESILHCPPPPTFFTYSLVHIHALWSPILHRVAGWARQNRIPVVWSPHGMLTPWAMHNKWWKKCLGWWLYQRRDLRRAALLHATAKSEVEDIRRVGLKNNVVVAPLGVHTNAAKSNQQQPTTAKYICFVSRIQRKKGLPELFKAWAKLPADLKRGWSLKIAGPDEDSHLAELYSLCDQLQISYCPAPSRSSESSTIPNSPCEVLFLGPVFDSAKDRLYAEASFSVLPTLSENFGSVVIESLALSTPVVCTKGAPWEDLESHHCGIWCDIGVDPLADALTKLMTLDPVKLREMGANGRKLVESKYTWCAVVNELVHWYEQVLNTCEMSPCDYCPNYGDTCAIK